MKKSVARKVRGQIKHLKEDIEKKKENYQKYKEGFAGLPVTMNPYMEETEPNFWLSCLLVNQEAMCRQVRSDIEALYAKEPGKSCPTEILETLAKYNAEGRPIWKPMHLQPTYHKNPFVTAGNQNENSNFSHRKMLQRDLTQNIEQGNLKQRCTKEIQEQNTMVKKKEQKAADVGADLFARGLCLPSDIKMTKEQQKTVIRIVRGCFGE